MASIVFIVFIFHPGKDKIHCFKAVFIATIGTNMPVGFLGLFGPKVYDGWIGEELDYNPQTMRHPREWFLGDGHFGCVPRYYIPPRKDTAANGVGGFSPDQLKVYNILQMIRSPIERIMREYKIPSMFKDTFRGKDTSLQTYFTVWAHAKTRDMYHMSDQIGNRRRGFGAYRHFV